MAQDDQERILKTEGGLACRPEMLQPYQATLAAEPGPTRRAFASAQASLKAVTTSIGSMRETEVLMRGKRPQDRVATPKGIKFSIPEEKREQFAAACAASFDRGAKTIDEANVTIDDVDSMLAKRVDAALANARRNETAQAQTDAQIRDYVRSLPALGKTDSKGRLEWILTAIDCGDHEAVAAVLGAPCFVSGLDRQQHAMVREHAARKFAPTEVTQREALAKVRQRLSEASQHYLSTYIDIIPPRADRKADESLKRLREGVAA